MKNLLSIYAFVFFFFISCNAEKESSVFISGKIKNSSGSILINSPFTSNNSDRQVYKIHLNKDGSFQDTLNLKDGVHFIFDENQMIPIHFSPSGKYYLEYDALNFKKGGLKIEGSDNSINKYLIDKERNRKLFNPYGTDLDEKAFRSFLNDIRKRNLERLENADLPNTFFKLETENINYAYLRSLYFYLVSNTINNSSLETKRELDIDYENESLFKNVANYYGLVTEYFNTSLRQIETEKKAKDPSYSLVQNEINELDSVVGNSYIKNSLIEQRAPFNLKEARDVRSYYQDFKKVYTKRDSLFLNKIAVLYSDLIELKKGNKSPRFKNYINYKGGKNKLDDYLGKYLYIDLWATWCIPCYNELPLVQDLASKYKDSNLKIISIAWKDDENKWRATIEEKSIDDGVHLFATDAYDDFFKSYGVTSIPRFILLDPEGNIVDYNAPRPSEKEELNSLLESLNISMQE